MYHDFVSRCILMCPDEESKILMYLDMYPVCHQGSAQDTCILMYLMCIPKCILDSFGIRVKYMHNVKDTCILLECNRACNHLRYIRIHKGYMYPSEYMQDTCKIHQNTSGYISDRNPPPKRIGNPPAPRADVVAARERPAPPLGPVLLCQPCGGHPLVVRKSSVSYPRVCCVNAWYGARSAA
jgi:hypothetical protein